MDRIIVKKQTGIYRYHTWEEIRTGIRLDKFGIWELDAVSDLSFDGHRFQFLNTFGLKVRYAISSLCVESTGMNDEYDEVISIVRRLVPECECVHLTPVIMAGSPTYYGKCSSDILAWFLEDSGITLEEFLTCKNYAVVVGDCDNTWERLEREHLINADEIKCVYG